MDSIIIDLDELTDFRRYLSETIENLENIVKKTENQLDEILSSGWKDQVGLDFCAKFNDDIDFIMPLIRNLDEYNSVVLEGYSRKIEEYLNNRF